MQNSTPDTTFQRIPETTGNAAGENSRMQFLLPVEQIIQRCGENDYSSSPLLNSRDDVGIQLLCNAAALHGLEVRYHRRLIFEVSDKQRRVVFRQNSPANSAVYTYCARQKHVAKRMMAERGVPVPSGHVFEDYQRALHFFRQAAVAVTVKPADGSSGYGVSSGIDTEQDFASAWKFAREESKNVIVEQNIFGEDIRVIVIAGKAQAAYVRVPAHVVGDGELSIRELVERKNVIRRCNPSLRLDPIKRFDLLERSGLSLDHVPAKGENIQLTSVANASAGGETVQVFDELGAEILEIAERAALCFPGLVQVGVDLIYVSPELWKDGMPRGYVIEVNSNPGICDSVFPSFGRSIDVPKALISHVFSPEGTGYSSVHSGVSVSLAGPYRYHEFERFFGEREQRQMMLIKQAAYGLNVDVEHISDSVFRLTGAGEECLFHSGMPEGVRMVSRKVTRNREWMAAILPVNSLYPIGEDQRLNRFRLLIVGGKLTSALLIRPVTRGQETKRIEVGDLVHPSVMPILDQTLTAIFDPPVVGIDLLAVDISSDLNYQPWKVKDAVCNPNLSWHHFPDQGIGRDVSAALVQASLPGISGNSVPKICERFVIHGDVQGADFRGWIKLSSVLHGVNGWVRNLPENGEEVVEAVLEGTPVSIEALYALCLRGGESAKVESIVRQEQPCTGKLQFSVIG
ncbi:acylphosphatase [uncultured Microbulbifer sp.]|uniref:acylphosphatase n=1 Tax=uncultured Microbulbifer sp. TaxID=348147 RepID=UPI0026261568|nr:acylphosphatase [uncultured Microbulbifer sp.]